jgi:hypothetical protein
MEIAFTVHWQTVFGKKLTDVLRLEEGGVERGRAHLRHAEVELCEGVAQRAPEDEARPVAEVLPPLLHPGWSLSHRHQYVRPTANHQYSHNPNTREDPHCFKAFYDLIPKVKISGLG